MTPRPAGTPSVLHPVALAAIALLLVNDHVLKARWPGLITGKLSDVAGLVFFPMFLEAWLAKVPGLRGSPPRARLWAAVVATVLVFFAVKTWPFATALYEVGLGLLQWPFHLLFAILSGQQPPGPRSVLLVRDATDLFALPFAGTALVLRPRTEPPADNLSA